MYADGHAFRTEQRHAAYVVFHMRTGAKDGNNDARRPFEAALARRMPLWAAHAVMVRDAGSRYSLME